MIWKNFYLPVPASPEVGSCLRADLMDAEAGSGGVLLPE